MPPISLLPASSTPPDMPPPPSPSIEETKGGTSGKESNSCSKSIFFLIVVFVGFGSVWTRLGGFGFRPRIGGGGKVEGSRLAGFGGPIEQESEESLFLILVVVVLDKVG